MIEAGILAAGEGSRLKFDGIQIPKPLVPVNGIPMIGRLIDLMIETGIGKISVIINQEMPEVYEYLKDLRSIPCCSIQIFPVKTAAPLESLWELVRIMQPREKFIVITVDSVFHKTRFSEFVIKFNQWNEKQDALMGVSDNIDDDNPLYVATTSDYTITGFTSNPENHSKYVSAGVYGLTSPTIPILKQCVSKGIKRLREFQQTLLTSGLNLKAYDLGKVIDVDHVGDMEKINNWFS